MQPQFFPSQLQTAPRLRRQDRGFPLRRVWTPCFCSCSSHKCRTRIRRSRWIRPSLSHSWHSSASSARSHRSINYCKSTSRERPVREAAAEQEGPRTARPRPAHRLVPLNRLIPQRPWRFLLRTFRRRKPERQVLRLHCHRLSNPELKEYSKCQISPFPCPG